MQSLPNNCHHTESASSHEEQHSSTLLQLAIRGMRYFRIQGVIIGIDAFHLGGIDGIV
jgi:hypothetical protein